MRRLSRSAILHIGSEKTGTTAIQAMLARRRDELARLGFWYPSAPGEYSHTALAIYAAPEHAADLVEHLPTGDFSAAEFARSLAAELAAIPSQVQTVIFSNEHCQSRLITVEHVEKLHALLAPHFETITVIVYLRRQDEIASSLYSTRLRGGDLVSDVLSSINLEDLFWARYFDYDQLLDRYQSVFCERFVKPVIYEPGALLAGSAVQDFLGICGLPSWLAEESVMVNRAIPAAGQKFLSALNAWHAGLGYSQNHDSAKAVRDACAIILEERLQGLPLRPARDEALQFYEKFRSSNERVRGKWFPDRSRLFAEDFSQYPAVTDNAINTHEAELRAAFIIIEELMRQNRVQRCAFEGSVSWRLTAPLRAVRLAMRRFRAAGNPQTPGAENI